MNEIIESFASCLRHPDIPEKHKEIHLQYCLEGVRTEVDILIQKCIMESDIY